MKPLVVANWKMNPQTLAEAKKLFISVRDGIKAIENVEVVICPPFTQLYPFMLPSPSSNLKLGAQDVFWKEKGAFTGEISPAMLKDLGCQYVIVGHSERRRYFGETDEIINKKIQASLKARLIPILCIGETKEERKKGQTFKILKKQLQLATKNISNIEHRTSNIIIAYEPIWAIGTGIPCNPEDVREVRDFIREQFLQLRVLYGGSVNSKNAASFVKIAKMDGLLVGGASLKAEEFIKIIKATRP